MEKITSLQNSKIKEVLKLWKRNEREREDLFLIEGFRELSRAASAHLKIESLFICPELFLGENEKQLIAEIKKAGAKIFDCTEAVFRKISYRDRPDGLIAISQQMHHALDDLGKIAKKNPFYVVAEGIEKPGNLGTILRSSDATAVDGVIVSDRQTDIHNPNVVRASVGTLFTRPVVEVEGELALNWLKKKGIRIAAATPSAHLEYTQADFRGPIAIVVGTEQYGLSKRWLQGADIQVKIPMLGASDSLNVAMAATLLLYEVVRQRVGV